MIAVSCGTKIFTVHHLVLSQYTRLTDRQTDRQTDGRTDGRTDRIATTYRALHYMQSHGKNGRLDQHGAGRLEQQQFGTAGIEGVNGRCQMRELRVVVYTCTIISREPRAELWGIVHKEVSLQEEKLITFSWNEDRRTV